MTLRHKVRYKGMLVSGAVKRNMNARFPLYTEKAGSVCLAAKLITEVLQQRMAILQFREMVAKYVFMR